MLQAAPPGAVQDRSSTTHGRSRAIGREAELGAIEAGKLADLLVLGAYPSADIANGRKVRAVVRGGVLRTIDELRALAAGVPASTP